MGLRFVFVMDPMERIDIRADSTFVLMLESQRRGHQLLFAQPKNLYQLGSEPFALVRPVSVKREAANHFTLGEVETVSLSQVDAVFMRKDPPFDSDYLLCTYLLDRIDRSRVVLINDSQGIRDFNEKLSALYWPELMVPSLVAADRGVLRRFLEEQQQVVVKPLLNAGGSGVILLEAGHRNVGSVLDLLTLDGQRLIEMQAYIPAITEGDKRIILLDGTPIGAVNRRPKVDDIRANMHVGGVAEQSVLTPADLRITSTIGPELKKRGLVFVGIDVIGGFLTEVNVTSPTGLQEIDRFDGVSLESQIIDWVERRRASL